MTKLDKIQFRANVGAPGGAGRSQAFFAGPEFTITLDEATGIIRISKGASEVLAHVSNMLEAIQAPPEATSSRKTPPKVTTTGS